MASPDESSTTLGAYARPVAPQHKGAVGCTPLHIYHTLAHPLNTTHLSPPNIPPAVPFTR